MAWRVSHLSSELPETFVPGWHDADVVRRMTYRSFGGGRHVSNLSLGGSSFAGAFGDDVPASACIEVVHAAIRAGVSMIDTAPWYGNGSSETLLGMALADVPRSAYYIHTKVGRYAPSASGMFDFSRERTLRSVRESLARLRLDYIDCVQVHDPEFAPSLDVVLNETLPALQELKSAGKIRRIGITGYPLKVLRDLASAAPKLGITIDTAVSYCRYNLHCTELIDSGTLKLLNDFGIHVINAAPLSMGLLTQRGPPSWHPSLPALKARCASAAAWAAARGIDISRLALAYSLAAPGIATTLVSTASLSELRVNLDLATGARALATSEVEAIAELRQTFFDPAVELSPAYPGVPAVMYEAIQSWEGVEVKQYWERLGRELMEAHYAALRKARSATASDSALPSLAESAETKLVSAGQPSPSK